MRLEIPDHKILVHEISLPIMWGDMDQLGHVNNTVYFKYMEQARVSWIDEMTGQISDESERPVVANAFCNFYQSLVFPGTVIVKLYVGSPGRTSIDTFVSIELLGKPGEVFAAGGATLVWVSSADGRPVPLPEPIRALQGKLPALPPASAPRGLPTP